MEQGYRDQPPTNDQHRVSHLRGTAADNQDDDDQKAEKTCDDQRGGNDLAPCLDVPRSNLAKGLLTGILRLLSPFLARSNSEGSVHAA